MKPETKFRQSKVLPFLKTLKNTYYFPIQQLAISGDPDFMLCIRGKFVALELKKSDEDPRRLQQWKLDGVEAAGGLSFVAHPDNWAEVSGILLRLDGGKTI